MIITFIHFFLSFYLRFLSIASRFFLSFFLSFYSIALSFFHFSPPFFHFLFSLLNKYFSLYYFFFHCLFFLLFSFFLWLFATFLLLISFFLSFFLSFWSNDPFSAWDCHARKVRNCKQAYIDVCYTVCVCGPFAHVHISLLFAIHLFFRSEWIWVILVCLEGGALSEAWSLLRCTWEISPLIIPGWKDTENNKRFPTIRVTGTYQQLRSIGIWIIDFNGISTHVRLVFFFMHGS